MGEIMKYHSLPATSKERISRVFVLFFVFCLCLFPGISAGQKSGPATAIINVRVFDGKEMIPAGTVLFQKGVIRAVGGDVAIPDGTDIIDGAGKTLLPGFFDCHVHVWHADNLKQAVVFGVTTVVDMFMDVNTMKAIKKMQVGQDAKDRAWLISPGTLATSPGGHGTQYGMPIPTLAKPEDAGLWVKNRIDEGSDFIKIIWDDGSAYGMKMPTLDRQTIAAICREAHQIERKTIIHAASLKQCIQAMDAGVDGLAHLFFENAADPDFGRKAAEKGVFVIPTLAVLEGLNGLGDPSSLIEDPGLSEFLKPDDLQMINIPSPLSTEAGAYEAAESALMQLAAARVSILAGTDAPNPGTTYGASLHRELELLVKAGLSPVEALRSATSVPARIFGLSDRGTIQVGKAADLVLVEGDPTSDIKRTRHIVEVWRDGNRIDRDTYKAAVAKEVIARENQKNASAPVNSESGLISDFNGAKITAEYGAGWSISTDAIMGGESKAEYRLVDGGALGSKSALLITGEIKGGAQSRWGGAFFSPGETMMQPANLSSNKRLSFWARGDGKTYSVMLFAQSLGYMPAMVEFTAGPDWEEHIFDFADFGIEGFDIMGIFIGGSTELGPFRLWIDNVRLLDK